MKKKYSDSVIFISFKILYIVFSIVINSESIAEDNSKNSIELPALSAHVKDKLDIIIQWAEENDIPPRDIPRAHDELYNLTSLRLWWDKLEEIPESIDVLINLTEIDLSKNKLKELPNSIIKLNKLKKINLSENKLVRLPEGIGALINLTEIDLNKNKLKELPNSIIKLNKLEKLNLSENKLVRLPERIDQLTKLQELDLNKNSLSSLPESILDLTELSTLRLKENPQLNISEKIFRHFVDVSSPEYFHVPPSSVKSLELKLKNIILWAEEHNISSEVLPRDTEELMQITSLHLDSTKFDYLPEDIDGLVRLQELSAVGSMESIGNLKKLPDKLKRQKYLRKLYVTHNVLQQLPEFLGELQYLEVIAAQDNLLTTIPESIGDSKYLRTLILADNKLTNLPENLGNLSSLQNVYLNNNKLSKLPTNLINLPLLEALEFSGNPNLVISTTSLIKQARINLDVSLPFISSLIETIMEDKYSNKYY